MERDREGAAAAFGKGKHKSTTFGKHRYGLRPHNETAVNGDLNVLTMI